jgi:hypothetical protein
MPFLDEVRVKRQKLADVLSDDDYSGIREIVEELYPDRAHFIYELLQNAEDTRATEVRFDLDECQVSFEHNGMSFTEENVWAITNIGKGTKRKQEDQIGRFGVGFKAVFAYSETPYIWSPSHSFMIEQLVLPSAIAARIDLGTKTRFEFPFNNPKKHVKDAYAEVEAGLTELAETTLLFLSHIEVIKWYISGRLSGELRRLQHSDVHIEIVRRIGTDKIEHAHFLRFSEPVIELEKQRIAVAFPLDLLPNAKEFDATKSVASQLRIIPANPGRVAVFFPAEKETSGLRFHMHAPFVPELSRASVKDTAANEPLFLQLAGLASRSLYRVRDLELLNADFLGVLPNPQDSVPKRYEPIRAVIVSEMNENPLTPTQSKTHAPAKLLLQAKASLKELLSQDDVGYFVDGDEPPQWAISAPQKNSNADKFLGGLAIRSWDADKFIAVLEERSSEEVRYYPKHVTGPDAGFMNWLGSKPCEWHQHLYAFLYRELGPDSAAQRLKGLRIVRLTDGMYSVGGMCYFPNKDRQHDDLWPRVERGVYQAGRNKSQQEDARKLLERIQVREVGESEQVQAILKRRYFNDKSFKPNIKDIKRFAALLDKEPSQSAMFAQFFIFENENGEWGTPSQTYLDSPIFNTGLRSYFGSLGSKTSILALSQKYAKLGISLERIRKFAEAVGARFRLDIEKTNVHNNPQRDYLWNVPGERYTSKKEEDYWIPHLEEGFSNPTLELAQLVWNTMCRLPLYSEFFTAKYQKNDKNGPRHADSQLVHTLRKCEWVPQGDGVFVRPSDADQALLPSGFPFDTGNYWLTKVEFGQSEKQRVAQNQAKEAATVAAAKQLGITDKATLKRALTFAAMPVEEQSRLLDQYRVRRQLDLPEHEPKNPGRRAEKIAERAKEAPERRSEPRTRSVSVGLDDVKKGVQPYLQQQYTNADGVMICQICKQPLPFKLDNGEPYFEKVEFLPELKKWHLENYLALCPNHSAMYQHANGSTKDVLNLFEQLDSSELPIVLAQELASVYFTKTHIADLRAVINVDRHG